MNNRELWRDSLPVLAKNPLYLGSISNPDGFARIKGKCGDTMEIYLKFGDSRVKEAVYRTDGCGSSNVCGSFAAEMSIGKSPDEILEITGEKILNEPPRRKRTGYLC